MRQKFKMLLGAIVFLAGSAVSTQVGARSGVDCLECVYTGSGYVDRDSREGVRAVRSSKKWHARAKQRYRTVKGGPVAAPTATGPVVSSSEKETSNYKKSSGLAQISSLRRYVGTAPSIGTLQSWSRQAGVPYNAARERGRRYCAVAVNKALHDAGIKGTGSALASSFRSWGVSTRPVPGAVAVYPGHVAIVSRVGSDGTVYIVGGNQGGRMVTEGAEYRRATSYRAPPHQKLSTTPTAGGDWADDQIWLTVAETKDQKVLTPYVTPISFEIGAKLHQIRRDDLSRYFLIEDSRDYLIRTAHPGGTMIRQGTRKALECLAPDFAVMLANAIRKARASGMEGVGVFSACRPPVFGVGGYANKFDSNHAVGMAVDMRGIGSPCSSTSRKWNKIATGAGLHNPYGACNRAEWNHYQPTPQKGLGRIAHIRKTITKYGPKDLRVTWKATEGYIKTPPKPKQVALVAFEDPPRHTDDGNLVRGVTAVASYMGDQIKKVAERLGPEKGKVAVALADAAERRGVPPKIMLATALLESDFRPNLRSKRSSAYGVCQLLRDERVRIYRIGERPALKDQVEACADKMWANIHGLSVWLGRDPTPTEIYLAHWQGLEGAQAILAAGPNERIRDLLDVYGKGFGAKVMWYNPVLNETPTVEAYLRVLDQRVNRALQDVSV